MALSHTCAEDDDDARNETRVAKTVILKACVLPKDSQGAGEAMVIRGTPEFGSGVLKHSSIALT